MQNDSNSKRLFYQSIASEFEGLDNAYDVSRRLEILFGTFLRNYEFKSKRILDAGCGYGAISLGVLERDGFPVSADIALYLVGLTVKKTGSRGTVADILKLSFPDESFDLVISSEVIEHTTSPSDAISELARVIRVGGLMALTTPNRRWQWLVRLASRLRLRPFQGFENFVSWSELESICRANGLDILHHIGFHPWPFQLTSLTNLSRNVDGRYGEGAWSKFMINQAILARKVE